MSVHSYFSSESFSDDREWDVFVSYKSTDRDELFVLHTLYPKLEQELGFRLNMHFRDFIPGESKLILYESSFLLNILKVLEQNYRMQGFAIILLVYKEIGK